MPTTTDHPHQQRIPNPRRLLILSPSSHSPTTIPPFLHALTGTPVLEPPSTAPANPSAPSFAGYTTHPPLQIRNKYYVAEVPVWVDEIALETDTRGLKNEGEKTQSESESESTLVPSMSTSTLDTGAEPAPATATEPKQGQEQEPLTTPSLWKSEFSGPEAQVVRDAVGAVVMCILNPDPSKRASSASGPETETEETQSLKDFLRAIGDVRALIEEERGGMGDVPGLVVLVGPQGKAATQTQSQSQNTDTDTGLGMDMDVGEDADEPFSIPWWEDQLYEMGMIGMEVVSWDPKGGKEMEEVRNQFGEYQGMRRIREILETHDWAPSSLSDDEEDKDDPEGDDIEKMLLGAEDDTGFGLEVDELEREMVGLRFAIERGGGSGREDSQDEGDDELRVDAVEALMLRMAAIRDMSDDLPEHERKRFAAKAVRDIMKEI
ncbi:hypothetical protein P170DRAFT_505574 [Aspergillus steynii IBT 23096]|uniref:Alpha and gamma adaptin binding protein p34 n=1 Tax=Aspergillus steynii IBT 23096 TaxID=1392250 RepID=A0A2I2GPY2_9EURO|nr:uncharacterized protein P170DRAFT_505574 [Aspergillus steynii IBT 23096]PLB54933.1 hypothetical protein P170DRAFT_505574 [Aspergillus steynii IBT 23096]